MWLDFITLTSTAFAQAAAGKQPSFIETFVVPMGGLVLIMYFLIIRPQQKKAKDLAQLLSALKPGDEVITAGGILGRVRSVAEGFVSIDIGNNTVVKVLKTHVSGLTKDPKAKDAPAK